MQLSEVFLIWVTNTLNKVIQSTADIFFWVIRSKESEMYAGKKEGRRRMCGMDQGKEAT
jgi:hypothetical protein